MAAWKEASPQKAQPTTSRPHISSPLKIRTKPIEEITSHVWMRTRTAKNAKVDEEALLNKRFYMFQEMESIRLRGEKQPGPTRKGCVANFINKAEVEL